MKTIVYPISKIKPFISRVSLVLAISLIVLTGCVHTEYIEITPAQLRSFQQREFMTTKRVAFPSVLSAFQDQGYIINSADVNTGFIAASSPRNSRVHWTGNINTSDIKATAFIEELPGSVIIRLNLLETLEIQMVSPAQTVTREDPVCDEARYDEIFEKIADLIFTKIYTVN